MQTLLIYAAIVAIAAIGTAFGFINVILFGNALNWFEVGAITTIAVIGHALVRWLIKRL